MASARVEVEFVFVHAASAVGAGRSGRMAHINYDPKRRTWATGAVTGVLRRSFLGAHWLPNRGPDDRGESRNSKCKFADDHDQIVPARSSADHEHLAAVSPTTTSQKRQSTGRIAAEQHRPIDKSEPEPLPSSIVNLRIPRYARSRSALIRSAAVAMLASPSVEWMVHAKPFSRA